MKAVTLITGGTGFIGSHLVDRLIKEKRNIRVFVKNKPIDNIEIENLRRFKKLKLDLVYGDLRDKKSIKPALKNVVEIIHLAAISRPMNIPKKVYYDINVRGTKNLLEISKNNKLKQFIHISTVSVLGLSPDGHPLKEDEFQEENQHYGLSKRQGEEVVLNYYKKNKIPVTVIRPCLMYGPRCEVRSFLFKPVKLGAFPLFKGGHAKMEFCYVDNLIEAILLVENNLKAIGEVYNVTDGKSYEIREVILTIKKYLNKKILITYLPIWAGYAIGFCAEYLGKIFNFHPPISRTATYWLSNSVNVYDCSKIKKLGYFPKITLEEGVKRSINWYKKRNQL